ncbi:D-alanine--D-alanine ligase family protein [Catenulispora rubra]|uniref:D-alanine--D-alanine ligase family protein n=1 Tax=Catenulispora rubra TaxID=280293 RepID=UPI0018922DBB|nr:D-alanine--D-alanine ligase family protein [Catenulispora rubra]
MFQVGIFYGGPSSEHDVSCASAKSVLRNLSRDRYIVHAIGVTRSRRFMLLPPEAVEYARNEPAPSVPIADRLPIGGIPVELIPHRADGSLSVVHAQDPAHQVARIDVAFPVMHGAFGEDGVIQGLLEAYGVCYVGSGVAASAVGMDKVAMKRVFAAEGIPVTPYVALHAERLAAIRDAKISDNSNTGISNTSTTLIPLLNTLRWPLFVKPAAGGSSIGVVRVTDPAELAGAITHALARDTTVIVEQAVNNAREIRCGVLAGADGVLRTSMPAEIKVDGGVLDYRQKYEAVDSRLSVPADLPGPVTQRVRELSIQAFDAAGAYGLARVDFLWDQAADELFVNEINTMPGFTARSSFARAWEAGGVPLPQLLSWLIDQALLRPARHPDIATRHLEGSAS